ncbi:MAG: hypothetical protein V3U59_09935, partial [Gammaproteobacteria bacterium]
MYRRASDARQRLLDKVVEEAVQMRPDDDRLADFIHLYYRNTAVDDLRDADPADVAGAAVSHFDFASKRRPGKSKVRVFNPNRDKDGFDSRQTIVQIVNDDMPFIVDSTSMALNREGMLIRLTVHPVFSVVRDNKGNLKHVRGRNDTSEDSIPESFVQIQVNREENQDRQERVCDLITSTLDDVRVAVRDWKAMRAKTLEICDDLEQNPPPLPEETVEE